MFRVFRASELEHSNLKEKGGKSLSLRNKTFPFGNSYSLERIFDLYAFPPFSLLPRILDEVAQDEANLLLVTPYWPPRPWFPRLLRLLVGLPRVLPVLLDLVVQPPFFFALSQVRKSSSFSMASLRQQGEVAGLSLRAA